MKLSRYPSTDTFDELFAPDGQPRPNGALFLERLKTLPDGTLSRRQKAVEQHLRNLGVTFNVYGHQAGTEKVWPFDLLPRIIDSREWAGIERGLKQRIRALNLFIDDMYNRRLIVKDRVMGHNPVAALYTSKSYYRRLREASEAGR